MVHLEMTITCLPELFGDEWNPSLGSQFAEYNAMYDIIDKAVINVSNGAIESIIDFISAMLVVVPGIDIAYYSANDDNVEFAARCVADSANQYIGPNTSVSLNEEAERQVGIQFDNNTGIRSTLSVIRQSNRINDVYDIMIFDRMTADRFRDQFCALCGTAAASFSAMLIGTPDADVRSAMLIADEMKIYRSVEIFQEPVSTMPSIEQSMSEMTVSD